MSFVAMWLRLTTAWTLAARVVGLIVVEPHPTECNMFYQIDACSEGLQFNPDDQMCDLPSRANCNLQSPRVDNPDSEDLLLAYPHPISCQFYFRLSFCPPGLNFNPTRLACDFPTSAGCVAQCPTLTAGDGMTITPPTCITGNTKIGDSCKFSCAQGYQLKGIDIIYCSESGWNSTLGLDVIPSCMTPDQIAQEVMGNFPQQTKGVDAALLFLVDESSSITEENFSKEIRFIQALVSAFPLSQKRSAGVTLFSHKIRVEISLRTNDTCSFLKKLDETEYHYGGTDILLALNAANYEISSKKAHNKNIVLLITDGKSPDPTEAANTLKNNGNILFTIGVGGYERNILESIASVGKHGDKLFYGITDFAVFDEMARQLETTYLNGTNHNCP